MQAGVHPEQPGNTLSREEFDRVWEHSVLLLQRGFKEGSILTVDPEEARKLGRPWTRRHALTILPCSWQLLGLSSWAVQRVCRMLKTQVDHCNFLVWSLAGIWLQNQYHAPAIMLDASRLFSAGMSTTTRCAVGAGPRSAPGT